MARRPRATAGDPGRRLPPVNALVDHPCVIARGGAVAREYRVELARRFLAELRAGGGGPGADGAPRAPVGPAEAESDGRLAELFAARCERLAAPGPRRVINATGVPLHTNLGRAPLASAAVEAVARSAGYTDLELDLATGKRGDRHRDLSELLAVLTRAEAGLAVNNGAAAVMLAARALARGGEVIVSRGELVEIGGGFRIPEVVEASGAVLVAVGTTNRTRVGDYAAAVTERTRMLLRVHRSNFRLEGFVEEAGRAELAALAAAQGLALVEDLGSGCLGPLERYGLPHEPTPGEALAQGVGLVTFSGDKLLGGVQAGLVAGRAALVERLARDPLMRALRLDKTRMAALTAALAGHLAPEPAAAVPLLGILARPTGELAGLAEELAGRARELGYRAEVVAARAPVGGGSLPGVELAGAVCRLGWPGVGAGTLARELRAGRPPVLGRVGGGALFLDPRTLLPGEAGELVQVLAAARGRLASGTGPGAAEADGVGGEDE